MNTSVSHLTSTLPSLSFVLQGAATGALIASFVLFRARIRGQHPQPWAVTAAWSTLGAVVAVVYALAAMLL